MDAAKGQYIHFLPEVLRLLAPEGILVSDNVLQDGDILESRFIVTRRNRTIHKRMREYLYVLTHHEVAYHGSASGRRWDHRQYKERKAVGGAADRFRRSSGAAFLR